MGTKNWAEATDDEVLEADLIVELNLQSLPDDDKAGILSRMTDIVQKGAINQVLKKLTPEQKSELDELMKQDDPAPTIKYIEEKVEDYGEIAESELIKFKRAMLTGKMPVDQKTEDGGQKTEMPTPAVTDINPPISPVNSATSPTPAVSQSGSPLMDQPIQPSPATQPPPVNPLDFGQTNNN